MSHSGTFNKLVGESFVTEISGLNPEIDRPLKFKS
jgi:hypothetical protein